MSTGFYLHIFVVFCTDFAELKGGAHLAVQFVLFLEEKVGGGNVVNSRMCLLSNSYQTTTLKFTRKHRFSGQTGTF